jgi:hypothetical protein
MWCFRHTGELRDVLEVGDEIFSDFSGSSSTADILVGLGVDKYVFLQRERANERL